MRATTTTLFLSSAFIFSAFTIGCGQAGNSPIQGSAKINQTSCDGFVQTQGGQQISLKSKMNFTVSSEVPDEFLSAITDAMSIWNKTLGKEFFSVSGRGEISGSQGSGIGSIRWLTEWPNDTSDQQADTSLYVDGSSITGADLKIDVKNFKISTDLKKGTIDFESLILHELGHVLGLKHDPSPDSVMYLQLPFEIRRTTLTDSDLAHVKCKYE